jgi:hypothetical protein
MSRKDDDASPSSSQSSSHGDSAKVSRSHKDDVSIPSASRSSLTHSRDGVTMTDRQNQPGKILSLIPSEKPESRAANAQFDVNQSLQNLSLFSSEPRGTGQTADKHTQASPSPPVIKAEKRYIDLMEDSDSDSGKGQGSNPADTSSPQPSTNGPNHATDQNNGGNDARGQGSSATDTSSPQASMNGTNPATGQKDGGNDVRMRAGGESSDSEGEDAPGESLNARKQKQKKAERGGHT